MGLPGMVKPMSEPGLQGSPLAFVDGGTLCNFPLHCFDGWWLSMAEEDSFRRRVVDGMKRGDTAAELYSRDNRFQPRNWQTLGLCLTAKSDVSQMTGWRELRPTRHTEGETEIRELSELVDGMQSGRCRLGTHTVTHVTTELRPPSELQEPVSTRRSARDASRQSGLQPRLYCGSQAPSHSRLRAHRLYCGSHRWPAWSSRSRTRSLGGRTKRVLRSRRSREPSTRTHSCRMRCAACARACRLQAEREGTSPVCSSGESSRPLVNTTVCKRRTRAAFPTLHSDR